MKFVRDDYDKLKLAEQTIVICPSSFRNLIRLNGPQQRRDETDSIRADVIGKRFGIAIRINLAPQ